MIVVKKQLMTEVDRSFNQAHIQIQETDWGWGWLKLWQPIYEIVDIPFRIKVKLWVEGWYNK